MTENGKEAAPSRLSVNINAECAETLRRVKAARGIDTTEAIRRAISLLDYFEMARVSDADKELGERLNEAIGANVDALRYVNADDLLPVVRAYVADQLTRLAAADQLTRLAEEMGLYE